MLKTHRRSERKGTLRKKMAAVKEDYFFGDDLEAILSAIDDNILDENEEFTSEINAVVEEIGDHPPSSGSVAERSKVSNSGPMVVSSNPALGHQC